MRQARNQQLAAATAMRLLKYDRARTKARKEDAEAYAAHLIAEFERQLAKEFSFDEDAIWKAAAKSVEAAVEDARRVIAARCAELGIPRRGKQAFAEASAHSHEPFCQR
jgi:hypothetical protein